MSAPMVRATLRKIDPKTQTRRIVKPQPIEHPAMAGGAYLAHKRLGDIGIEALMPEVMPYGAVGDRLWVREAWRVEPQFDALPPRDVPAVADVYFEASRGEWLPSDAPGRLRPGMFMPRWASRITLEVTGVRIERLQAISEADAKAEGANPGKWPTMLQPYQAGYSALWDSINGAGSWNANPFVWVVTFRRI